MNYASSCGPIIEAIFLQDIKMTKALPMKQKLDPHNQLFVPSSSDITSFTYTNLVEDIGLDGHKPMVMIEGQQHFILAGKSCRCPSG